MRAISPGDIASFGDLTLFGVTLYPYYIPRLVVLLLSLIVVMRFGYRNKLSVLDGLIFFCLIYFFAVTASLVGHYLLIGVAGGFHSYSALAGAVLGIYLGCKLFRLHFWSALDAVSVPGLALYAIFRIGCFLKGDDIGILFGGDWAIPNDIFGWRHPVQLYDSYLNLMAFFLFKTWNPQRLSVGSIAVLAISINAFIRYFMEFFRWGASAIVINDIASQNQIISMMILVFSPILYTYLNRIAAYNRVTHL